MLSLLECEMKNLLLLLRMLSEDELIVVDLDFEWTDDPHYIDMSNPGESAL